MLLLALDDERIKRFPKVWLPLVSRHLRLQQLRGKFPLLVLGFVENFVKFVFHRFEVTVDDCGRNLVVER